MLLRIQPDESLRSYVERNIYLGLKSHELDILKGLYCVHWSGWVVKSIADILGWHGCYGYNKLLHLHTSFPFSRVLKTERNLSYSGGSFIHFEYIDSLTNKRSYCPLCVKEDIRRIGYSYWKRLHPLIKVCAKHDVELLTCCQFCDKPFSRDGHPGRVMWEGCAGRSLGDAESTVNEDPRALRLAQFFEKICSIEHHLPAETASLLFTKKLKNIDCSVLDQKLRQDIDSIALEIESSGRKSSVYIVPGGRTYALLELLSIVYESFAEFLNDLLNLDPTRLPIDSSWSTYTVRSGGYDHFVEENYRLGSSSWMCSDIVGYLGYPYRDFSRPQIYPCCNLPYPRRKGHQLKPERVEAALPAVPRLGATGWAPVARPKSPLGYQSSSSDACDHVLK